MTESIGPLKRTELTSRGVVRLLTAVATLAACSQERIDMPKPPNLSAVRQEYNHPNVPLTEEIIVEALHAGGEVTKLLEDLDELDPVVATVLASRAEGEETQGNELNYSGEADWETANRALDPSGRDSPRDAAVELHTEKQPLEIAGMNVEGEGYVVFRRICGGWGETPVADEDNNGFVSMMLGVSSEQVEPVFWGKASRCKHRFEGGKILLDGDAAVYAEGLLEEKTDFSLLVTFNGRATIEGEELDVDVDFRLIPARQRLELSVSVTGGNVLLYVMGDEDDGTVDVGFVASNGEWSCDFEQGTCWNKESDETIDLY